MLTSSIMDYRDRGPWGDPKYRGNCSGYVIKSLLEYYKPKKFLEMFAGSGTGFDVAKELGYTDSVHLDLNPRWGGFNALTDEIPEGANFIFAHPPYHDIIFYSGPGGMWGEEAHPDDLSRSSSYEEFLKKLDLVHAKLYASLRNGGRLAVLIGDFRRKGQYFSIMKDMTFIGDLETHILKIQHNSHSDRTKYNGKFIPILHEHLLIFRKNDVWLVPVTVTLKRQQDLRKTEKITWRDLVQASLEQLGGAASLDELYRVVEGTYKAQNNRHWREKVRQTLQLSREFEPIRRGEWRLSTESQAA